jgi:hypothetical protein
MDLMGVALVCVMMNVLSVLVSVKMRVIVPVGVIVSMRMLVVGGLGT